MNCGAFYDGEKHSRKTKSGGNEFTLALILSVIQADMSKNASRCAGLRLKGVFQHKASGSVRTG